MAGHAEPTGTSTLVVGAGSSLMGDDGLGLRALESIRDRYAFEPHVELLDGGVWGMNLLPFIEEARRLLVLDAIEAGKRPGELVRIGHDDAPRFFSLRLSPHQMDLREVFALAELRGTLPELVILGLQPERIELREAISEPVARGLEGLVEAALETLSAWGHRPIARSDPLQAGACTK